MRSAGPKVAFRLAVLLVDALHVLALCGFAVAQPIYHMVEQNAELLVASLPRPRRHPGLRGDAIARAPRQSRVLRLGAPVQRFVHTDDRNQRLARRSCKR
jgi:hypothetical protein